MPQNSNKQITFACYSQKRITKEAKFRLQTDFRWNRPYTTEQVLPNKNYFVRKIGTKETQILHRMRLRQITPRQPIPDIPITPREMKPDPKVVIKNDDWYARAWECEYEKPIFDSDYNNLVTPKILEITERSEEAANELTSTQGTIRENSQEIIPQADRSYDGTDTDH